MAGLGMGLRRRDTITLDSFVAPKVEERVAKSACGNAPPPRARAKGSVCDTHRSGAETRKKSEKEKREEHARERTRACVDAESRDTVFHWDPEHE